MPVDDFLQPIGIWPGPERKYPASKPLGAGQSLRRAASPSPSAVVPPAPGAGSIAPGSVAPPLTPWDKIKGAINEATVRGLGRWLTGPGAPLKAFNPFSSLRALGPDNTFAPERYKGIGTMGQRLRLGEDEASPVMVSLRAVAQNNPLIRQGTVKVADLPPGVTGQISYVDPNRPEITLAPIINQRTDPVLVATHEVVGHASHGAPFGGQRVEDLERRVRPQAEGMAVGAEKALYKKLAPRSAYDLKYLENEDYWRAKSVGAALARHIEKTGKVPPWQVVHRAVFGRSPSVPTATRMEAATGQGGQGTEQKPSPPGALRRAVGLRPPSNLQTWEEGLDYGRPW